MITLKDGILITIDGNDARLDERSLTTRTREFSHDASFYAGQTSMKALTEAYLSGVLHGDGWCTRLTIGLRVKDRDFADAFALSLSSVVGRVLTPKLDERGYWLLRVSNLTGRFDYLRSVKIDSKKKAAAWLRGMFDSEGNASLGRAKHRPNCANSYHRRIAFFSTNVETVHLIVTHLKMLGLESTVQTTKPKRGHWGSKPVFSILLRKSKVACHTFAKLIGSNLVRKANMLRRIVASYCHDLCASRRAAQLKAADVRRRKTMEITLPRVVEGIKNLIENGVKPTQRRCRAIKGYNTIQGLIPQSDLVQMAMK